MYIFFSKKRNYILNWITTTRKSGERMMKPNKSKQLSSVSVCRAQIFRHLFTQLSAKTVLFQTIQFGISTQFSSI